MVVEFLEVVVGGFRSFHVLVTTPSSLFPEGPDIKCFVIFLDRLSLQQ